MTIYWVIIEIAMDSNKQCFYPELLPLDRESVEEEEVPCSTVFIEWSRTGCNTAVLEQMRFYEIKFENQTAGETVLWCLFAC